MLRYVVGGILSVVSMQCGILAGLSPEVIRGAQLCMPCLAGETLEGTSGGAFGTASHLSALLVALLVSAEGVFFVSAFRFLLASVPACLCFPPLASLTGLIAWCAALFYLLFSPVFIRFAFFSACICSCYEPLWAFQLQGERQDGNVFK